MAKLMIPVTKGKAAIEVDTDTIPEDVYAEAMLQGLKVLLNRGQSKITKASTKDAAEMAKLAMEAAAKQLELVMTSKIKFSGASKSKDKTTGTVKTEAVRLAKIAVKEALKAEGLRVSHFSGAEITKAAKALIDEDPSFLTQAKENLDARAKVPVPAALGLVKSMKESPAKVEAAEKKKAKDQLSAKQAGKIAPRAKAKSGQQPTAH